LLTHQAIYSVEYLVTQTGLAYGPRASCNHEGPEYGSRDQTNGANRGLVNPFLLANHGHNTTAGTLQNHAQRCLQPDQRLQISAFLQLHQDLATIDQLLNLVALYTIDIFEIISEPLYIYFFAVIKPGIHSSLSFKLVLLAL
jgi:hypothetical protein